VNVEILYCAWNRREFTEVSFELLKRNTKWSNVSRLVVYDDGSEDGTREYLEAQRAENLDTQLISGFELRHGGWNSTGATMNDYISLAEGELFVKVDNDIAMPPGWLERVCSAWYRNQDYELVGMEAAWNGAYKGDKRPSAYTIAPARHIGGVGLMRVKAFEWRRPVPLSLGKNGRAGFTIWQHRYHPKAGWLKPDLPNVQLDKIPEEPWASLAKQYVQEGWARAWDPYLPDMKGWWEWLPPDVVPKVSRRRKSKSSPT